MTNIVQFEILNQVQNDIIPSPRDTSRTNEQSELSAVWLRAFYSFSCTPCRGAFGGKSTAKPPTRQRSHQTKNSYCSRITRHFRSSNKFGFCCLLVLFDCSLMAIVGVLTFLLRITTSRCHFYYFICKMSLFVMT